MKRLINIILLSGFAFKLLGHYTADEYITHVKNAIKKANNLESKLSQDIFNIEGMSGLKIRHLLNNVCELPGGNYFEIGAWKGSTFISALYKNDRLNSKIVCDTWLSGTKEDFLENVNTFIPESSFFLINDDCFQISSSPIFTEKINIYFYDGEHSYEDQYKAFTYFNDIFDDIFIAIVDDYYWYDVRRGTEDAFEDLGYSILFEEYFEPDLSTHPEYVQNGLFDGHGWWNGLYIAVIKKSNKGNSNEIIN